MGLKKIFILILILFFTINNYCYPLQAKKKINIFKLLDFNKKDNNKTKTVNLIDWKNKKSKEQHKKNNPFNILNQLFKG